MSRLSLYYVDPAPGHTGYGWAVCNAELKRALRDHCEMVEPGHEPPGGLDAVFMPVDNKFMPVAPAPRGKVNVCLNFFESALSPSAAAHATRFQVRFVGSSWCQRVCDEAGISGTQVLIQGVDADRFKPAPPRTPDGSIRIFSGGKFETRKGQDLVLLAFREFVKTHPNAHLVCNWHNPWVHLAIKAFGQSGLNMPDNTTPVTLQQLFERFLLANGVRRENFTVLPALDHDRLAAEMRNTDFGVCPNRCEGGTNLVLMEYAACGRPVVANIATGQADVAGLIAHRIPFVIGQDGWAYSSAQQIAAAMDAAVADMACPDRSLDHLPIPRWSDAARTVVDAVREALADATMRARDA